jgi:hypothetical protein
VVQVEQGLLEQQGALLAVELRVALDVERVEQLGLRVDRVALQGRVGEAQDQVALFDELAALRDDLVDAAAFFDVQVHRGAGLDAAIERVVVEELAFLHRGGGDARGLHAQARTARAAHHLPGDQHDDQRPRRDHHDSGNRPALPGNRLVHGALVPRVVPGRSTTRLMPYGSGSCIRAARLERREPPRHCSKLKQLCVSLWNRTTGSRE